MATVRKYLTKNVYLKAYNQPPWTVTTDSRYTADTSAVCCMCVALATAIVSFGGPFFYIKYVIYFSFLFDQLLKA